MKINDQRFKKQELSFEQLDCGKVYVSSRLQKYVMSISGHHGYSYIVDLEDGEVYDEDECNGDVFTPVEAELIVK